MAGADGVAGAGAGAGAEVLAADATIRRAGRGFDVEPLPIAQVKGKDKGVRTYRVTAVERTDGGRG